MHGFLGPRGASAAIGLTQGPQCKNRWAERFFPLVSTVARPPLGVEPAGTAWKAVSAFKRLSNGWGSPATGPAIGSRPDQPGRSRMRRREFIAGFGSAAAWPLAARAQQTTVPVVGFLGLQSADDSKNVTVPFLQGLKETGFVEA